MGNIAKERTSAEIKEIAIKHLNRFTKVFGYDAIDIVRRPSQSFVYIGFTNSLNSYLHLNIFGSTFYILGICIPPEHRGMGHGSEIYTACEDLARELGCEQIRQTPSGWAHNGENRVDWLIRRGWIRQGLEVCKFLPYNYPKTPSWLVEAQL